MSLRCEIGVVTFTGAGSAWTDPVAAIEKAAVGQDFDPATEATLATALRAIYHRQGYLDVAMTGYAHGEPRLIDGKVMVPVSATIAEGAQYKVAGLHLTGDVLMTPEEFTKAAKLHPGDIANEDLLRGTLAVIASPYKAHGYLRAKIERRTYDGRGEPHGRLRDYRRARAGISHGRAFAGEPERPAEGSGAAILAAAGGRRLRRGAGSAVPHKVQESAARARRVVGVVQGV